MALRKPPAAKAFACCSPNLHSKNPEPGQRFFNPNRRGVTISALVAQVVSLHEAASSANALDLFKVDGPPEQTVEEAVVGIKEHAKELLAVKEFLERRSWKEAQRALRGSSSNLKQDMYTIIQGKPGNERPQLRKLYSDLFKNVTRLDYAARDEDARRIWEFYGNIAAVVDDILSRIRLHSLN